MLLLVIFMLLMHLVLLHMHFGTVRILVLLLLCLCKLLLHHLLLHLHIRCLLLRQVLFYLLNTARLHPWTSSIVCWHSTFAATTSLRGTERSHLTIPSVQVHLLIYILIHCTLLIHTSVTFVWWTCTSLPTCPKIACIQYYVNTHEPKTRRTQS